MPNQLILRASAIAMLVSLGGCQFFGKLNLAGSGSQEQRQAGKATRTMPSSLGEGREHLRANRNGLAIDAFNLALVRGEDPAAAYNGLGVAYARVGRSDLAYRFFKKANASDPDNPVYAGNLIRLVDSPAFALNQIDRAPAAPPARTAERPVTASAAAAAPRVPGKLYREGRGQISLTTRNDPTMAAPDQRGAMTQVAVRPAVLKAPMAAAEAAAEPKAAEPAAAPANGKRKVIEFAPAVPAEGKSGHAPTARRNAVS
jgi:tetratricopeptide (TPR) repeat protein